MRAVAAAFVLIAGAAVVLWYGNTLNSLVLGGLIGGLAALLLSIPISLIIFSYISRHHDERMRLEYQDQDEVSYAQEHKYPGYQDYQEYDAIPEYRRQITYIIDEDAVEGAYGEYEEYLDEEEDARAQAEYYARSSLPRQLPAPRFTQEELRRQESQRRTVASSQGREFVQQNPSASLSERGKDVTRRPASASRRPSPGSSGAEVSRSQFQTQALRAARKEAVESVAKQHIYEDNPRGRILPPAASRGFSSMPRGRQPEESSDRNRGNRGARSKSLPQQSTDQEPPRRRRQTEPTNFSPPATQSTQPGKDATTNRSTYPVYQHADPETDYFIDEAALDDLKKPLQRRAPYMYEDDPLRQEMAQHLDEPITRRSSRKLIRRPDNT